jgi:hypothetical protein
VAVAKLSDWKTEVEGCLALKGAEPAATRSSPTTGESRVRVEADAGYLRVEHQLNHACCLTSETRVERVAGEVRLTERLLGTACRCQCNSTIKTRIQLEAGDRELRVNLEENGAERQVHRAPVPEPKATTAPKLPKKVEVKPPAAVGSASR